MTVATTNQTRILQIIGTQCMLLVDIAKALNLPTHAAMQAASAMIQRGYVERVVRGCYQLTDAGKTAAENGVVIKSGPIGPMTWTRKSVGGSLKQRAWNVMRMKRDFTVPDLVCVAAKPDDVSPTTTVQEYLRALVKAEYVVATGVKVEGTRHGSRHRVYRLCRNTGEVAPSLIRKETILFDHNISREVVL